MATRTVPAARPPCDGPPAWIARACAAMNTHADPGPWSIRPARKHGPGCRVTTPSV